MTAEKLREIFGRIDDEFIEEAETYVPRKRSSKPIWIITSASAAVIAVISCVNLFNTFGNDHRPEISNYAVTTTVTDSRTDELVTEEGKIPEKTERSAETTVAGSSSDAVDVNTEVTETAFGYESSIQNAVTVPNKTEAPSGNGESSGEKTALTERPHEVTKVSETEPAVVTSEVQTAEPVTENPPVTEFTDSQLTALPEIPILESLKRESFVSELKLVPGFTDKIYRIKFDAEKADECVMIYDVYERKYWIDSPNAYTICIYDVVIDGDDYEDFLKKGNYILKTENEYTVDEYFALDDQVISVEELISSGFYAMEYSTGSEND